MLINEVSGSEATSPGDGTTDVFGAAPNMLNVTVRAWREHGRRKSVMELAAVGAALMPPVGGLITAVTLTPIGRERLFIRGPRRDKHKVTETKHDASQHTRTIFLEVMPTHLTFYSSLSLVHCW